MITNDKLSEIVEFGAQWRERHPIGAPGDPLFAVMIENQDGNALWSDVGVSHDDGRAIVACHPTVAGQIAAELLDLRRRCGVFVGEEDA